MQETTQLINSKDWYSFAQAFYNIYPKHAQEFTDICLFLGEPKIRYIVATRGIASAASLIALLDEIILYEQKNEDLKASLIKLISNSTLSEETIEYFLNHAPTDILSSLAEKENVITEKYEKLLSKKSATINFSIAKTLQNNHPGFNSLLVSKDLTILEGLLHNPSLSEEDILTILAKFKFELPSLRSAARNPNLPYELMVDWSKTGDIALQRTLALNSNISVEAQEILSSSADERVLVNLANNPALSEEMGERFLSSLYSDSVRLALASNPQIKPNLTNELLVSSNDNIRAEVIASQRNIPAEHLNQIAVDETEINVIKQIILKHNLEDKMWLRIYQRAARKTENLSFFYMRPLNKEIINTIKNKVDEKNKYLLILQPAYQIKKAKIGEENLITSVSRYIKHSINKGNIADSYALEELQALIASQNSR